jgi:hypothetical protein
LTASAISTPPGSQHLARLRQAQGELAAASAPATSREMV